MSAMTDKALKASAASVREHVKSVQKGYVSPKDVEGEIQRSISMIADALKSDAHDAISKLMQDAELSITLLGLKSKMEKISDDPNLPPLDKLRQIWKMIEGNNRIYSPSKLEFKRAFDAILVRYSKLPLSYEQVAPQLELTSQEKVKVAVSQLKKQVAAKTPLSDAKAAEIAKQANIILTELKQRCRDAMDSLRNPIEVYARAGIAVSIARINNDNDLGELEKLRQVWHLVRENKVLSKETRARFEALYRQATAEFKDTPLRFNEVKKILGAWNSKGATEMRMQYIRRAELEAMQNTYDRLQALARKADALVAFTPEENAELKGLQASVRAGKVRSLDASEKKELANLRQKQSKTLDAPGNMLANWRSVERMLTGLTHLARAGGKTHRDSAFDITVLNSTFSDPIKAVEALLQARIQAAAREAVPTKPTASADDDMQQWMEKTEAQWQKEDARYARSGQGFRVSADVKPISPEKHQQASSDDLANQFIPPPKKKVNAPTTNPSANQYDNLPPTHIDLTAAGGLSKEDMAALQAYIKENEVDKSKPMKIRKKGLKAASNHLPFTLQQSLFRFPNDDRYFVIGRKLGGGSFGSVKESVMYYRMVGGQLVRFDDTRAVVKRIKDLPKEYAGEPAREAKMARRILGDREAEHATLADRPGKEYIKLSHEGDTNLDQFFQKNKVTELERLALIKQLLVALRRVHIGIGGKPHYYTDLKPENIMLRDGEIKLVDAVSIGDEKALPYQTLDFTHANAITRHQIEAYALIGVCMAMLEMPDPDPTPGAKLFDYTNLPFLVDKTSKIVGGRQIATTDEEELNIDYVIPEVLDSKNAHLKPLFDYFRDMMSASKDVYQAIGDGLVDGDYIKLEEKVNAVMRQLYQAQADNQTSLLAAVHENNPVAFLEAVGKLPEDKRLAAILHDDHAGEVLKFVAEHVNNNDQFNVDLLVSLPMGDHKSYVAALQQQGKVTPVEQSQLKEKEKDAVAAWRQSKQRDASKPNVPSAARMFGVSQNQRRPASAKQEKRTEKEDATPPKRRTIT